MARGVRKGGKDERPFWGVWTVMQTASGERRVVWMALDQHEAMRLREAGYLPGQEVQAQFDEERNLLNFRQAHALAKFVRDNTDAFPESLDSHRVLKRIQVEADIEVDLLDDEVYVEGLGWLPLKRKEPRSLAFDRMSQETWRAVFKRFKDYCIFKYFPTWGPVEIAQFEDVLRGNSPP